MLLQFVFAWYSTKVLSALLFFLKNSKIQTPNYSNLIKYTQIIRNSGKKTPAKEHTALKSGSFGRFHTNLIVIMISIK